MMTLEDFKKSNMCWNGNGYYTTDKEWNSNYQIAKNVEKEFFTHYDNSLMQPQNIGTMSNRSMSIMTRLRSALNPQKGISNQHIR